MEAQAAHQPSLRADCGNRFAGTSTGSCRSREVDPAVTAEFRQALGVEVGALLLRHHERLAPQIATLMERLLLRFEGELQPRGAAGQGPPREAGACGPPASDDEGELGVGNACGDDDAGGHLASGLGAEYMVQACTTIGRVESAGPPMRHAALDGWSTDLVTSSVSSTFTLDQEDSRRKQAALATSQHVHGSLGRAITGLWAGRLMRIIKSIHFEAFFTLAIISNSLMIGVEVEYMATHPGELLPRWFYGVTHAYTLLFVIELGLRLTAHRSAFFVSDQWAWNMFDVVVVLSALLEMCIDIATVVHGRQMEIIRGMSNIRIVRVLRITRFVRALRMTRMIRFVSALRTLVYSILATLKSLVWAFVLMAIIMYIFGIVFTQSASEDFAEGSGAGDPDRECQGDQLAYYWGSLFVSMLTLFKSITGGVNWEVVARPLGGISWFLVALFACFIFFSYFAVLNVITGFFVQSAIDAADHDPDLVVQSMITGKNRSEAQIRYLFQSLDTHGTGKITYQELDEVMRNDKLQAHFEALQVNANDAWTLFKLINSHKTNTIDIDEFIMGCMRLRGPAKALDIAKMMSDNRWMMKRLSKFMHQVEVQLEELTGKAFRAESTMAIDRNASLFPLRNTGSTLGEHEGWDAC